MTGDQIQNALRAAPFRPFRLHLADQRKVEVPHAEFVMLFPGGRNLIVATPSDDLTYQMIDVAHIVSLDPLDDFPGGLRLSNS